MEHHCELLLGKVHTYRSKFIFNVNHIYDSCLLSVSYTKGNEEMKKTNKPKTKG